MRIDANGISIHYSIEGPDDGPVVVLSHSLAANLAMWDWQMPVLEDFRVVRYDTRGHGGTDAPAGEYTLETLADDLFGFLDALNLDTVHYVGLSMGGMIGQTAALKDQSRFLSLGLCDTSSVVPLAGKEAWTERIAVARAEGMEAVMPSTIERWFSPEYQKNESGEVDKIREMIRSTPVDGFCGCCHAIMGLDLTDQLSVITLPTLLVVGEDDPGTPVSAHEVIQGEIVGSELIVLPGARHFSNVEQQGAFNEAIATFLKAQL
tara:strand:- start:7139 stop:7927 length:789 start_codon:yes stop_codon:yes gene_type:complete